MFPNTNGTGIEPEPIRNGVRGHVRRVSKEDGEFMQVKESAARNDKMGKRAAGDQSRQQSRTKSANRGDDETREGGALIPPFGKWDEKNPESEDFTGKFERARVDRNEPGKPPSQLGTPTSSFTSQGNPNSDDSAKPPRTTTTHHHLHPPPQPPTTITATTHHHLHPPPQPPTTITATTPPPPLATTHHHHPPPPPPPTTTSTHHPNHHHRHYPTTTSSHHAPPPPPPPATMHHRHLPPNHHL
ncbi:hypothetical protein Vadar_016075 [Vaccinium darrowii]|uniref:Uncharacterized protein n=1 Tax=Vaccinium darrowii TaxID=229202 RepID=A0ACB7XA36_9ERIC|nr:hypothetical protein Vadar_016075 [Vaccinium darrowii]